MSHHCDTICNCEPQKSTQELALWSLGKRPSELLRVRLMGRDSFSMSFDGEVESRIRAPGNSSCLWQDTARTKATTDPQITEVE